MVDIISSSHNLVGNVNVVNVGQQDCDSTSTTADISYIEEIVKDTTVGDNSPPPPKKLRLSKYCIGAEVTSSQTEIDSEVNRPDDSSVHSLPGIARIKLCRISDSQNSYKVKPADILPIGEKRDSNVDNLRTAAPLNRADTVVHCGTPAPKTNDNRAETSEKVCVGVPRSISNVSVKSATKRPAASILDDFPSSKLKPSQHECGTTRTSFQEKASFINNLGLTSLSNQSTLKDHNSASEAAKSLTTTQPSTEAKGSISSYESTLKDQTGASETSKSSTANQSSSEDKDSISSPKSTSKDHKSASEASKSSTTPQPSSKTRDSFSSPKSTSKDHKSASEASKSSTTTQSSSKTRDSFSSPKITRNERYYGTGRLSCELGEGWEFEQIVRQQGRSVGQYDVYYFSPDNVRLRSKVKLSNFLGPGVDLSGFDYNRGIFPADGDHVSKKDALLVNKLRLIHSSKASPVTHLVENDNRRKSASSKQADSSGVASARSSSSKKATAKPQIKVKMKQPRKNRKPQKIKSDKNDDECAGDTATELGLSQETAQQDDAEQNVDVENVVEAFAAFKKEVLSRCRDVMDCTDANIEVAWSHLAGRKKSWYGEPRNWKIEEPARTCKKVPGKVMRKADKAKRRYRLPIASYIQQHKVKRISRCGVCPACMAPNCGKCSSCRDMTIFGGRSVKKQGCLSRRCLYKSFYQKRHEVKGVLSPTAPNLAPTDPTFIPIVPPLDPTDTDSTSAFHPRNNTSHSSTAADIPVAPTRQTEETPLRCVRQTQGTPLTPSSHVQHTPFSPARCAQDRTLTHVQDTPLTSSKHAQDTPLTSSKHAQDTPLTPSRQAQDTPVTPSRCAQDTPVTPSRQAQDTFLTPSRPAQNTPLTSSKHAQDTPLTPSRPTQNTPLTPFIQTQDTPLTQSRQAQDTTLTPSRPAQNTPLTPSRQARDTPLASSRHAQNTPVTLSRQAQDTPLTPSRQAQDTPVTPSRRAPDTPLTPSRQAQDTPVTPSRCAQDTPVTPSRRAPDTPLTPFRQAQDTSLTPFRCAPDTPLTPSRHAQDLTANKISISTSGNSDRREFLSEPSNKQSSGLMTSSTRNVSTCSTIPLPNRRPAVAQVQSGEISPIVMPSNTSFTSVTRGTTRPTTPQSLHEQSALEQTTAPDPSSVSHPSLFALLIDDTARVASPGTSLGSLLIDPRPSSTAHHLPTPTAAGRAAIPVVAEFISSCASTTSATDPLPSGSSKSKINTELKPFVVPSSSSSSPPPVDSNMPSSSGLKPFVNLSALQRTRDEPEIAWDSYLSHSDSSRRRRKPAHPSHIVPVSEKVPLNSLNNASSTMSGSFHNRSGVVMATTAQRPTNSTLASIRSHVMRGRSNPPTSSETDVGTISYYPVQPSSTSAQLTPCDLLLRRVAPHRLAPRRLAPRRLAPRIVAPPIVAPPIVAPPIVAPPIVAPHRVTPTAGIRMAPPRGSNTRTSYCVAGTILQPSLSSSSRLPSVRPGYIQVQRSVSNAQRRHAMPAVPATSARGFMQVHGNISRPVRPAHNNDIL